MMSKVAGDIRSDSGRDLSSVYPSIVEIGKSIELNKAASQEIRSFYSRIHEAEKRIIERDKYLKDSDRYEDEIRRLREKGQPTTQVDVKYNTAHTSYVTNNEYLKVEIDEIVRIYNDLVIPKVKFVARTNYAIFAVLTNAFEPFKDTKCVAANSTTSSQPQQQHHRHAPPPPPQEVDDAAPPKLPPKRPPKGPVTSSVTSSSASAMPAPSAPPPMVENPFDDEDFDNPFDDNGDDDGNDDAPPPPRPQKAASPTMAHKQAPPGAKPLPKPGKALPAPPPKVPAKPQHSTQYELESAVGRA